MARIRTIKPDLFRHQGLFDAEKEEGLPVRLSWAGLFTCSDREGRFKWRPRELKLDVLPYDDDVDFSRVLDALLTRGYLVKYRWGTEWYGEIPSWDRHQHVNPREHPSVLPPVEGCDELIDYKQGPTDASISCGQRVEHASGTRQPPVSLASGTRLRVEGEGKGKGREGKGKGMDKARVPRASFSPPSPPKNAKKPLPEDFAISEAVQAWAHREGHTQLDRRLASFKDYILSCGKEYVDWDAAFRRAISEDWAHLNNSKPNGTHKTFKEQESVRKAAEWKRQKDDFLKPPIEAEVERDE